MARKSLVKSNETAVKRILMVMMICPVVGLAQVGIGTSSPSISAKLQVDATDKGFLPPRVALSGTSDVSTITSPATGLLVYNTATAGTSPANVTPGFYYYDGSKWQRLFDNAKQITKHTVLIDDVQASTLAAIAGNILNWSDEYTASGGDVVVTASFTAFRSSSGTVTYQLTRDGVSVAQRKFYFNDINTHRTVPTITAVFENGSGTHNYGITIVSGSGSVDLNDYCTILVTESNIP